MVVNIIVSVVVLWPSFVSFFYYSRYCLSFENKRFLDIDYGYVAFIATDPRCRGSGIGYLLVETGTAALKDMGCKTAVAYCASPTSTRLFLKHGYEIWGSIPYRDFRFNGRYPFEILPDEVNIVAKQLL